jgi:uncharacterized RDD family membrane protein YckC
MMEPGWEAKINPFYPAGMALGILGGFLYHLFCEGIHGATLGKLICGLRVISSSTRPCSMKASLIRGLGWFIDALVFGLVGYTSMSKTPLKQRYGDVWAKTVVVKTRSLPPSAKRQTGYFLIGLLLGIISIFLTAVLGLIIQII